MQNQDIEPLASTPAEFGAGTQVVAPCYKQEPEIATTELFTPVTMWSFRTFDPLEGRLHSRLYKALNTMEARRRLVSRYPNTCGHSLDDIRTRLAEAGAKDDAAIDAVLDALAAEIVGAGESADKVPHGTET